jgi:hypothetical protein
VDRAGRGDQVRLEAQALWHSDWYGGSGRVALLGRWRRHDRHGSGGVRVEERAAQSRGVGRVKEGRGADTQGGHVGRL